MRFSLFLLLASVSVSFALPTSLQEPSAVRDKCAGCPREYLEARQTESDIKLRRNTPPFKQERRKASSSPNPGAKREDDADNIALGSGFRRSIQQRDVMTEVIRDLGFKEAEAATPDMLYSGFKDRIRRDEEDSALNLDSGF